jgi:N-glycosylase/DNA lyase
LARDAAVLDLPPFDLRHTLESGQYFRWGKRGDVYRLQQGGRVFTLRQEGRRLHAEGADEGFLRDFLGLDHDLPAMRRALGADRSLKPALDAFPGLRILKQDPWECLCAFLTSIASNIPRITRNVESMASAFGKDLGGGLHAFPEPGEMGDEAELRRLGLGFRAPYLAQAGRLAKVGLLDEIALMDDADAKSALMVLPGVGEKVADCILLFAYGRLAAFPVDTWIRQLMVRHVLCGRRLPDGRIRSHASRRWGAWAGYAQQHLYHWGRTLRA